MARRHNAKGRTTGEARFVQVPFWVLETDAARRLSGKATKVLLYMVKRHNGANNGQIGFGARSGCFVRESGKKSLTDASIGIGPSATSSALYELERAGFIRCTRDTSFDQKRLTKEWRLTWLPVGTSPPTKEFATATGDFKRPRSPKKQKPVRQRALSPQLQCASAHNPPPENGQDTPYSAPARTIEDAHSAPARTHLVTIPSAPTGNGTLKSEDAGGHVSVAVLASRLGSAARCPSGSKRDRAPAADSDTSGRALHRLQRPPAAPEDAECDSAPDTNKINLASVLAKRRAKRAQ